MAEKKTNTAEVRNEMFEANQLLAVKIVNDFLSSHAGVKADENTRADLNDLAQTALWKCTESFDSEKGIAFSTYAYTAIQNTLKNYVYGTLQFVHVPYEVRMKIYMYNSFVSDYYHKNETYPTDEEVSNGLNMSVKDIHDIQKLILTTSRDQFTYSANDDDDERGDLISSIPDTSLDPSERARNEEIHRKAQVVYEKLDDIDKDIFDRRILEEKANLQEIADAHHLSFEAIRKREHNLLVTLRKYIDR